MRVRAVTIDFWNTLLFDGPPGTDRHRTRRLADFAAILGEASLAVVPDALARAYDASGAYLEDVWSRHEDVPVEGHVTAILRVVDPGLPGRVSDRVLGALVEAYGRPALLAPPRVDEGALPALRTLCERGYTLAVVSNTMRTPGAILRQLLERHGLLACFTHTTFSDEVGVRKPAPEIFALALRAVGGEAATAVHVGDDPVLDVRGARAAGMRVIQVTSASRPEPAPDGTIRGLAALPEALARLEG